MNPSLRNQPQGSRYAQPGGRGPAPMSPDECRDFRMSFEEGAAVRITATTERELATVIASEDLPFAFAVVQFEYPQLLRDGYLTFRAKRNGEVIAWPWHASRDGCVLPLGACVKKGERFSVHATVSNSDLLTNMAVWLRGAVYLTDDPFFVPPVRPFAETAARVRTVKASIASAVAAQLSTTPSYAAITDITPGVYIQSIGGALVVFGHSVNDGADTNGLTIGDGESIWFPVDDLRRVSVAMLSGPVTIRYGVPVFRDVT